MKIIFMLSLLALSCTPPTMEFPENSDVSTFDASGLTNDMGKMKDLSKDFRQDTSKKHSTDLGHDISSFDTSADVADLGPMIKKSVGCMKGKGLSEGKHTFMQEGRERNYMLRLPKNYTRDKAWPLVFALHGNGGTAAYWDAEKGERNIRGVLENEAILVMTNAIDKQWRDYKADKSTWPARIESELSYFDEILSQTKTDLCIQEEAIFSIGFSGGGSFSGVLGCRRKEFRAIAVGGSVIYFDPKDCISSPAAWITNGKKDFSEAREDFRDFFLEGGKCKSTNQATSPSPCVAYEGCSVATPVHYCQHPDGHVWPAFGTQAMWDFFKPFVAQ